MVHAAAAAVVLPDAEDDPVLAAILRAPLDDHPESEEERLAVQAAKASGRMRPHAVIESAIQNWRNGG